VLALARLQPHIKDMNSLSEAHDILTTYNDVAAKYAVERSRVLYEKPILDRMLGVTPRNQATRTLLDLGCGPGVPLAQYLADRGLAVTGVDGAPAMVDLFRQNMPKAQAHHADMRTLDLGQRFDAIMAWDSMFHLSAVDQRTMFPVFARHAAPKASLLFTSGHEAGERWGQVAGAPVYHASLDPEEYRALLASVGFKVIDFRAEDPELKGHTTWLARYIGDPAG